MSDSIQPPDILPSFPDLPPPTRRSLWGRIAVGFIPSALFLLCLLAVVVIDPNGNTASPSFLILVLVAFVVGTPILLMPWSHHLLKTIHGPITDDKRAGRIGMIVLVTAGMCFANFVVVFAGCTTILMTVA